MYTLLSGAWKYYFQRDEFCVLILGLDNAGKTTFLEQTKIKFNPKYQRSTQQLKRVSTTVGLNIGKIDVGNIRMLFWDLGGQEELRTLWDKYYSESHGIIYLIDSADPERFDESKDAFVNMLANEHLDTVPLLILANKQDKPEAKTVLDIKEAFHDSARRIGNRDCMIRPISALTGEGVMEGIEWMRKCVERNPYRPPRRKNE